MDVGYKKDESATSTTIGTPTTIATLATVLFSNFSTFSNDITIFVFDPRAAEVLLSHLSDSFIPNHCDELDRLLRV